MSSYKVTFYFPNTERIEITTANQPDELSEFIVKMASTNYQSFMADNNRASMINMENVLYAVVEKIS